MPSTKSAVLIGPDKFLSWQQLNGCSVTRPFLSLQRVWLARLAASHVIMQPHPLSLHAAANGAHELDAPPEQGEHNAAVGCIPS